MDVQRPFAVGLSGPYCLSSAAISRAFSTIYTLSDDALLAAINYHPLYAGWPDYDNTAT